MILGSMVDGTHQEIHSFEASESAFHVFKPFVTAHRFRRREAL
jgi:hypothetical protein